MESSLQTGWQHCAYLNISVCELDPSIEGADLPDQDFDLAMYNLRGQDMSSIGRFPIRGSHWKVTTGDGVDLKHQVKKGSHFAVKIFLHISIFRSSKFRKVL